jgi:hypothetical protein
MSYLAVELASLSYLAEELASLSHLAVELASLSFLTLELASLNYLAVELVCCHVGLNHVVGAPLDRLTQLGHLSGLYKRILSKRQKGYFCDISYVRLNVDIYTVKKVSGFPSPAGMSLTKVSLDGNNLIIPDQGDFGKRHPGCTVKKGSRVSRPQPGCHYQTLPGRE